ncbi:hypothetical protein POM88_001174 [Heracleum sosnowskyi]|uniref:Uncharacterized protein n=1 Tax=Heracleum sosnowskyi TaxID=360622 RepID=A0AAD8N9E4_9APIA|nr:hypothetical protein POM88_001174 [Heracleum sosnowskyi]
MLHKFHLWSSHYSLLHLHLLPSHTHSFVSSPQPREGDNPNPSGFDHPSPIMDEPPSSGPKEPISQSDMDNTPSNTEKEQGATLPESEIVSALFNLQGASYLREDVVTASDAVKDSGNVAVTGNSAVKDSVKVAVTTNPVVQAAMEPIVNLSADSNIYGKATVTSAQPNYDEVLIEDVSDDDVPLSQFLKVHSKPSVSLHASTTHTHASRLSEGVQKKREIKEKRGEHKNEMQPNELAKGEGLEHVQSEFEVDHNVQALGLESSSVRSDEITQKNPERVRTPTASKPHSFPSSPRRLRTGGPSIALKLEAQEHICLSMETELDSLSTMVASGFSSIQEAIQVLSANIDAANLPKGEKSVRSEYVLEQGVKAQEVLDTETRGEPASKEESRSKGESASKGESGGKGEKPVEHQGSEAGNLFEYEIDGETVLMSKKVLEELQGKSSSKRPILPLVSIKEPTS